NSKNNRSVEGCSFREGAPSPARGGGWWHARGRVGEGADGGTPTFPRSSSLFTNSLTRRRRRSFLRRRRSLLPHHRPKSHPLRIPRRRTLLHPSRRPRASATIATVRGRTARSAGRYRSRP